MAKTNRDNSENIRHRIDAQIELAEWLARAAAPTGDTLMGAVPQFVLLATALGAHVGKLKEIRKLL